MLTRRRFVELAAMTSSLAALGQAQVAPDYTLEIAPYLLEASPKHRFRTLAYNGQVPGPLLRMKQGKAVTIDVHNRSPEPEVVHWHGLHLPSEIDGAMEEGTPMIPPGGSARYTFTPTPAGFRWFHTHTTAGRDLTRGQYSGQHGFLMVDPTSNDAQGPSFDREIFLALHDWGGREMASDDGSMNPSYEVSTINGKMLGFGEPIRVKAGERIMLHVLNSSPTEVHWVALAGHTFQVVALDGNPLPSANRRKVPMLRLAPAERVSALVEMNVPGVWVLGEVRKHIQTAGMGIVVEYAYATGSPKWIQPTDLVWDYTQFASPVDTRTAQDVIEIPLAFDSKFEGHGSQETWRINGHSYPNTEEPMLTAGRPYRLVMKNLSMDDHPIHLHRHTFQVTRIGNGPRLSGLAKDVVLVPAKSTTEVEFIADNPGRTLFHCHQQNHMDRGFMMVFRYA